MTTRIVKASGPSGFRTLDTIIVVMRVCAWLNIVAASISLIVAINVNSGSVSESQSTYASICFVGICAGLGGALFCFAIEQLLLLGRRAVVVLEMIGRATGRQHVAPVLSAPSRTTTLPPPP